MANDDLFRKMTREAIEELARGQRGWREVASNTLLLACFGMLYNHLGSRIVKPLWFFAASVATGVIGYIVSLLLGGG